MSISRDLQALLASAENLAALNRIYVDALDRILQELARGVTRAGAGRARDVLIRIRHLAAELNPRADSKVRDWIRRELPKAFILGDESTAREVRRILAEAGADRVPVGISVGGGFTVANRTALGALVATMVTRLEAVHRQILETAGFVIRNTQLKAQTNQAVREHVVGGIIRGATGREISNDISKAILTGQVPAAAAERLRQAGFAGDLELYKRLSDGQFIQVGGRRFDVRSYANLVARTMTREAATVATILRLQQSGVEHIQVSQTMPSEPDVCSLCAGNVYYIGAGVDPLGFPSYTSMPGGPVPLHPHCRHVALPFVAVLKPESTLDELRANVSASVDFWGATNAEADKRIRELVKAGGIAALHKYNPRLFGKTPPTGRAKGAAA